MGKKPSLEQEALYHGLQGQFKKIEKYTDQELDATVAVLGQSLPSAYQYLNFIDAYFERRARKARAAEAADATR